MPTHAELHHLRMLRQHREQRHLQQSLRQAERTIAQRPLLRSLTQPPEEADPNLDYFEDLFFYPCDFGNMVAGATKTQTVTIQADSQFEWMRSTVSGNLHGATEPFPDNILLPITVFISDTGSGRQLMSSAVQVNELAGKGTLPFINPASRIFEPSAVISITAVSFSAASQYDNIEFVFHGRKIFKGGPPR